MNRDIKILIVDDHPIFRKGLRTIIESEPDMHIIGETSDGESALTFLKDQSVDVVVLDLDMPKMNGLEMAQVVIKQHIPVEIIILTMHKEEQLFNRAMDLGIKGYISKENAITEIAEGIRAVIKGKYYVCSMMSHFLVRRDKWNTGSLKPSTGIDQLTTTERKILKLIAQNKSSKEIANELSISPKTVENHRTNICGKLNLHGSHALLRFLIENKPFL